jgi:hypothetical protein
MKLKHCFNFLLILFLVTLADAASVERIDLFARQNGVFTDNVRAALNSSTNFTVVIWDRNTDPGEHHSIWGLLVGSNGTPSGASFPLVNGPNAQTPKVVYNPDNNQFLLVYSNETNGENGFEIFAQKLNATGRRAGKAIRISLTSDRGKRVRNDAPQVVYDAKNHSYVILWRRFLLIGSGPDQGLIGCVLNSDLTVRRAPVLMSPLQGDFNRVYGPFVTNVALHPVNGKLLIAGFSEDSAGFGSSWRYFVARTDATLQKPQTVLTPLKSELSSGAAPYVNFVFLPGTGVEALFVEGTGVKKRKMNPLGAPIGPVTLFFTGTAQTIPLEFPVAAKAASNNRSEASVVAVDDSSMKTGSLWMQIVDTTGNAIGQPFQIQSSLDIGSRPEIFTLPISTQTGFTYAVIFTEGVRTGTNPNESSGLVLLKVSTP